MYELDMICKNCGCTFGSHCGGAYISKDYEKFIPMNACPGNEGRMDWDKGGGTIFDPLKEEKI